MAKEISDSEFLEKLPHLLKEDNWFLDYIWTAEGKCLCLVYDDYLFGISAKCDIIEFRPLLKRINYYYHEIPTKILAKIEKTLISLFKSAPKSSPKNKRGKDKWLGLEKKVDKVMPTSYINAILVETKNILEK